MFDDIADKIIVWLQYLKLARRLEAYGEIVFPHCACDSRKDGHVMASVGIRAFRLQACKEDGSIEVRQYFYFIYYVCMMIETNIFDPMQNLNKF